MDGKRNVAAAFYWASNFARMVNGLGRAKIFGATCLTQQSWPLLVEVSEGVLGKSQANFKMVDFKGPMGPFVNHIC